MRMWVHADLDRTLRRFMVQLRNAANQAWQLTKPDPDGAVVAALESVLRERCELRSAEAQVYHEGAVSGPGLTVGLWPFAFRNSRRLRLSVLPVSRT